MTGSMTAPENVMSSMFSMMPDMSSPSPKKYQVPARPSATPSSPLAADSVSPSTSTMAPVWPGVSPSACSTPNSRRRCITDISTVLTMPNAMMTNRNPFVR